MIENTIKFHNSIDFFSDALGWIIHVLICQCAGSRTSPEGGGGRGSTSIITTAMDTINSTHTAAALYALTLLGLLGSSCHKAINLTSSAVQNKKENRKNTSKHLEQSSALPCVVKAGRRRNGRSQSAMIPTPLDPKQNIDISFISYVYEAFRI